MGLPPKRIRQVQGSGFKVYNRRAMPTILIKLRDMHFNHLGESA